VGKSGTDRGRGSAEVGALGGRIGVRIGMKQSEDLQRGSESSVNIYQTTRVTTQERVIFIIIAMRISNFIQKVHSWELALSAISAGV
jgi:hypothetical protein